MGKNDSYFPVLFFHIYFSPHHFPQHWGLKPDKDSTTELPPPQSFSSPTNFSLVPFPPVSLLELLGLQRADLPNSHPSLWSMPKFFPDLITVSWDSLSKAWYSCAQRLAFWFKSNSPRQHGPSYGQLSLKLDLQTQGHDSLISTLSSCWIIH